MSDNRIKKAVIREDLLAITGDYRKAILLNQFIYWSERVSDADKFIEKENEIAKNNGEGERELFYGWIYKTAEELADEVMLGLSASQIRRYINDLVDIGYLSKRNNPKYKWDRTLQYRVNLVNIAKSLKEKGYPLSDYKIEIPDDENTNTHECAINNAQLENQSQASEQAIPENTNIDYINRDYSTENTDKYAFPDKSEKVDVNIYASFPEEKEVEKKKPSRYIPENYTEEQLVEHIRPVIEKSIDRQCDDRDDKKELSSTLIEIVRIFYRKYYLAFGKRHRILSDMAYENIAERFMFPPDIMCDEDTQYDISSYADMMDVYFTTEYNKQKKYGKEIELSISHFMSDEIRSNLFYRACYYEK